jgi:predicted metalloprotease with PDZ domain
MTKTLKPTLKTLLLCTLLTAHFAVQSQDKYVYSADLKNISNDKVAINLVTPAIKEKEIVFSFPRVIPGSYSEKSFGKFIEDFKVYDARGKELKAKKINSYQYSIANAQKINRISYKVNDTWDSPDKDFIFQPGGSNIDAGKNVIINTHAFFGYFEGYSQLPFEVNISKPAAFYASTNLPVQRKNNEEDLLSAKSYVFLADNPVFYNVPDTTSFIVGNTSINVSVYSVTGKVTSKQISGYLRPMAEALQTFFNGLPVDRYQFLFFFEDAENPIAPKESGGGGYGALEHNYSSLYFLPEMSFEPQLKSMVNDVASHEFLHILTPLNLHSEQIEYFDFVNPKMSRHLWLYEGVTEYFSNLVQLKSGLINQKKFFSNMQEKIEQAEQYGDFAMTTMSLSVLEEEYQKKYSSVYNRGALIAFMLDMEIREKTNYTKDLKSVIVELAGKYGAGKPFNDANFLKEFVVASHPDVQTFIDNYIEGDESLPFKKFFAKLGYEFSPEKKIEAYFVGRMGLKYDEGSKGFVFIEVDRKNALTLQDGDQFLAVNDIKVDENNLNDLWEKYFQNNTDIPNLALTVKRNGEEKILSGPLFKGYAEVKNYLNPLPAATAEQSATLSKLTQQ